MDLKFYINDTHIEEPVGFDTFKSVIERTENHGIGAEVSFGALEFYGVAYHIIKTAYNTDIDSELVFRVEMKCSDSDSFNEIYYGMIDLASYEENNSDYCSVKCKVGEIGVRTTFNNRADTQVYLNSIKSMDGVDLPVYAGLDREIVIPGKVVMCTNRGETNGANSVIIGSNEINVAGITYLCARIGFDNQKLNEFGELASYHYAGNSYEIMNNPSLFDIKYDSDQVQISYNLSVKLKFNKPSILWEGRIMLSRDDGGGVNYPDTNLRASPKTTYNGQEKVVSDTFTTQLTCTKNTKFYLFVEINCRASEGTTTADLILTLDDNNTNIFEIKALTSLSDSSAKISLVHESFSRISEIIAGLAVKSDWYGRIDSFHDELYHGSDEYSAGGGALKCITNGLRLRQATLTNGGEPYLFLSFKELFLAMKAVDNVGWGFSEEDGELYVRVEPWQWFYKSNVILDISNVAEITRKIVPNEIPSIFKIGYSKYSDIEELNANDTFHTERTFTNSLKAVSNTIEQLCKFVADPYVIEFTRRKALDKTTEDWKYDNDIFLLTLRAGKTYAAGRYWGTLGVDVGMAATENTVISPETMINARITPERNALRWADSLFGFSGAKNFKLTAGTGNMEAKGRPQTTSGYYYLSDSGNGSVLSEREEIPVQFPKLKTEVLIFDYPLKINEYMQIKNNPYGIIKVNGEKCYLKKMEYSYMEGLANFELKVAVQ